MHKRYAAGRERLCVEWKGWRINPQVCYDLRFPVFCRNRFDVERPGQPDFDLQIFVANWPAARAHAWKTLLRARAIENLCWVAAVNRVGVDGNGLAYDGDSVAIDFLGHVAHLVTLMKPGYVREGKRLASGGVGCRVISQEAHRTSVRRLPVIQWQTPGRAPALRTWWAVSAPAYR